ncbi:MAG: tetratricopeptide repeat protein [Phycisphaerae bacterium]|jgi:tetratricopeptide (TPR) repeat protein
MTTDWKGLAFKAAIILLLAMFVYIPAMQADWIWDDNLLITHYPLMHMPDGLKYFWCWWIDPPNGVKVPDYLPLAFSGLWAQWQLFKDMPNPATGFHVVNVILHGLGAVLVWLVLRRLKVPGAFLCGLVFAVHPVNVSSVAWVSELKNTLSIIFFMLAILAYLRYDQFKQWRQYALSLLMFILALLSKSSVVVLPVVLMLCVWWRRQRKMESSDGLLERLLAGPPPARGKQPPPLGFFKTVLAAVAPTIPFFVLAALMSWVTVVYQNKGAIAGESLFVNDEGNLAWRLAMAGTVPWFYLLKDLVPYHLLMIYPRWSIHTGNPLWFLGGAAILAAAVALLLKRRRPWAQSVAMAMGYFLVMLLPVMGFFDMYFFVHSLVADHWQYLANIGVFALVAGGGSYLLARYPVPARFLPPVLAVLILACGCFLAQATLPRHWLYVAAGGAVVLGLLVAACLRARWPLPAKVLPATAGAAAVIVLSLLTWQQNHYYKDQLALWGYNLPINPNAWMGQYNMGTCLSESALKISDPVKRSETLDKAVVPLYKAAQLRPSDSSIQNNLGLTCYHLGRLPEAEAACLRSVALDPRNYLAYVNLGLIYQGMRRWEDAYRQYGLALRYVPGSTECLNLQSTVLIKAGKFDEAIDHTSRILARNPASFEALYNRAQAYFAQGKIPQARADLENCLRLTSTWADPVYLMARVLQLQGEPREALELYSRYLTAQPSHADARYQAGLLLAGFNRTREAVSNLTIAAQLEPNVYEVQFNLAAVLARGGNLREAIPYYRKALELKADSVQALCDLAMILASKDAAADRNLQEAATLAERACQLTAGQQPMPLETLAMVRSESGRAAEALALEEKALQLVAGSADKKLIESIEARVRQYKANLSASQGGQKP